MTDPTPDDTTGAVLHIDTAEALLRVLGAAHAMNELLQLAHDGWCVIANAGLHHGGWDTQHPEWVAAAQRWRDEFHTALDRYLPKTRPPAPERPDHDAFLSWMRQHHPLVSNLPNPPTLAWIAEWLRTADDGPATPPVRFAGNPGVPPGTVLVVSWPPRHPGEETDAYVRRVGEDGHAALLTTKDGDHDHA